MGAGIPVNQEEGTPVCPWCTDGRGVLWDGGPHAPHARLLLGIGVIVRLLEVSAPGGR